ncbi:DUF4129 domain-containing protein [Georgenia wutianyii]|uniref:DUF4129 domain-containing protein n=1 Tax=Georgenia wutianyii TaxID=2585135 RepID=A0ABX5VLA6_9MICO|nr:DUF4129 domain-containing protein [Georgenia wutianyii]QDB78658.1 DUF4129 domain-containing protein [Georgenia wutianyii]
MDGGDGAVTRRRPSPLLPLLAGVVALAVVAGSAVSGPWRLPDRDVTPPLPSEAPTAPTPTATADLAPPPEPTEGGVPLTLVLAVIGLLLLFLLLRTFLRRATLARGTTGATYEAARGTVAAADAEPEPDLPALRRGVAAAREVLAARAEPDDAIIAAWLELEAAAASSGVVRRPSDTPTELTTAVLDATSADPDATRGLLRLYHRARFAPHAVMTADDVAAARHCLERLAESWEGR